MFSEQCIHKIDTSKFIQVLQPEIMKQGLQMNYSLIHRVIGRIIGELTIKTFGGSYKHTTETLFNKLFGVNYCIEHGLPLTTSIYEVPLTLNDLEEFKSVLWEKVLNWINSRKNITEVEK